MVVPARAARVPCPRSAERRRALEGEHRGERVGARAAVRGEPGESARMQGSMFGACTAYYASRNGTDCSFRGKDKVAGTFPHASIGAVLA